ncbi:UNVERIFIED_CONTAM: hypothetical protein RMT77_018978 [Armadillidium vulgare]
MQSPQFPLSNLQTSPTNSLMMYSRPPPLPLLPPSLLSSYSMFPPLVGAHQHLLTSSLLLPFQGINTSERETAPMLPKPDKVKDEKFGFLHRSLFPSSNESELFRRSQIDHCERENREHVKLETTEQKLYKESTGDRLEHNHNDNELKELEESNVVTSTHSSDILRPQSPQISSAVPSSCSPKRETLAESPKLLNEHQVDEIKIEIEDKDSKENNKDKKEAPLDLSTSKKKSEDEREDEEETRPDSTDHHFKDQPQENSRSPPTEQVKPPIPKSRGEHSMFRISELLKDTNSSTPYFNTTIIISGHSLKAFIGLSKTASSNFLFRNI